MDDRAQIALHGILTQFQKSSDGPCVSAAMKTGSRCAKAHLGIADIGRNWPVQETSRYAIACITKLLVAMIAVRLEADGRLNLDEAIHKWLPDLETSRDITTRHLLTHTSGYQGPLIYGKMHRAFSWDAFFSELIASQQTFRPGTVFNYENTGHVIVGKILERVTGHSITALLSEHIFSPLGITPGSPLQDYKSAELYVSPHRYDEGKPKAVAPSIFGSFWEASLADITLTIDDLVKIGDSIVDSSETTYFQPLRDALSRRRITLPHTISGLRREHSPLHFNTICAGYSNGWYGYAEFCARSNLFVAI